MTTINVVWKIVVSLAFGISVCGNLSCRTRFRTDVVCVAGQHDYMLHRGTVSDNNNTIGIVLKECRIIALDNQAFINMYNLREIDLSRNKISHLAIGVFDRLPKLWSLRLSKNLLKTLPLGLFDNLRRLIRLDVSDNKIISLELGIFNNLPKLLRLELTGNAFLGNDLNSSLFGRNPKIKFLHFSGNNMSEAPDQLLNGTEELTILGLNNCSLTEVPKFATRPNLKTLELQINQIRNLVDPALFLNYVNLVSLYLTGNDINNLNETVFKPLTKLKNIDLSFNKIKQIPENLFFNMISIESVDLSNNLIEIVPVNAFQGTRLKKLNLNANRISFFEHNFLLELKKSDTRLRTFYFNDNNFQCPCLLEVINEVKKYGIAYNSDKYNGKEAVCFMTNEFDCMRHKIDIRSTKISV